MESDAFFTIGKSHKVCQDYARVTTLPVWKAGRTVAVVSDGCSTSPNTDFGARLLTMAAIECVDIYGEATFDKVDWMIWRAENRLPRNLPQNSLDATLLLAFTTGDYIQVMACGDGFVLARDRETGEVEILEIDCQNIPNYSSYLLDPNRLLSYNENLLRVFEETGEYAGRIIRHWKNIECLREGVLKAVQHCPVGISMDGNKMVVWNGFAYARSFKRSQYDLILLCSDGIKSFQRMIDGVASPVPVDEMISHLINIKSFTGEFVTRRMRSFLNRFCAKNNWWYIDDVGVAGIYLEE